MNTHNHPRDLTPAMDRITSPSPAVAMLLRNAAKARKHNEEARTDPFAEEL